LPLTLNYENYQFTRLPTYPLTKLPGFGNKGFVFAFQLPTYQLTKLPTCQSTHLPTCRLGQQGVCLCLSITNLPTYQLANLLAYQIAGLGNMVFGFDVQLPNYQFT
jgi:hypothetical protein